MSAVRRLWGAAALCGAFTVHAFAAGATADPDVVAPQDAEVVSTGHYPLSNGGRLSFLSLSPATWGLHAPPRFRVYVLPGSGCNGLAPIARAYFRGLSAGEVVVPHKQHVNINRWMGLDATCGSAFVRHDRLDGWAADAKEFVDWHLRQYPPVDDLPVALVGISEGAELLPVVAAEQPGLTLLALVGSTGLDPLESLQLQAARHGAPDFVAEMMQRAADAKQTDASLWAGRSLGYWRTLLKWQYSHALLNLRQTLWLGFGSDDAAVPLAGLKRFQGRAQAQGRPLCLALFQGADHGLLRSSSDAPLQQFWALLAQALSQKNLAVNCPPPLDP